MKKLYSVNRILLFNLLAKYDIELLEAGMLFCSGLIKPDVADQILKEYPNAISLRI